MPPLMGWTAAANDISIAAWTLFATQFLWQFPHFLSIAWMYRDQYARAGILMLPVVEPSGQDHRAADRSVHNNAVPVSLAPFFFHAIRFVFLIGGASSGSGFCGPAVKAARARTDETAKMLLLVSVIYLPVFFC